MVISRRSVLCSRALVFLILLALCGSGVVGAAGLNLGVAGITPELLFPGAQFDASMPSFVELTGVEAGHRPLRPDEVVSVLSRLAEMSPNAKLIEYSRSHEGRPLVIFAVSGQSTIADLDGFKDRHARYLDPRLESGSGAEAAKAVAWMAYGIHGDELSSSDAAVALAYWLTVGHDDLAQSMRENLLVLIDPCENPDGRARYLAQTQSFAHRTANPDQDDLSHSSVWPWGRGNHYLFDMNRDWFTMTQPESARSRFIAQWLPQMLVDSHEMGSNATYLFPPPRHPFNPHLPPNVRKWERPFSDDQARALDQRGYSYFTGEWNEEFFPGYGSSWASYHGAIGILYEMSGTSGTLVRKRGGTIRTFAQAVEHQVASSVANLESLARNSSVVLADQRAGRQLAIDKGAEGAVRAWFFPSTSKSQHRLHEFAQLLIDQGIEVDVLTGTAIQVSALTDARTGHKDEVTLDPGSLVVRLDQPAGLMARVLLDPHVPMESAFLQEEREYIEKGKGSRLYETTAWSLPLAKGLPAFWSSSVPEGSWTSWSSSEPVHPTPLAGDFSSVVFAGHSDRALRMLAELLQVGVTIRVAEKPFTIGGRAFDRGAFVVRREGNGDDVGRVLSEASAKHLVEVLAVGTSRSENGPDLGGSHFPVLVAPRTGVLTGMPVSPTAFGSIWHLLDTELDLRFSALDVGRFSRVDLSRYNVLIVPPIYGGPGMYRQLLGERGIKRLRQWVEAGGTVIGIGGGARMLADQATELGSARFRSQVLDRYPPPVWSIPAESAEGAGRQVATGLRVEGRSSEKEENVVKAKIGGVQPSGLAKPYDVAPVIGAGARPFTNGFDQGTPLAVDPVTMADWLKPVLPPGQKTAGKEDLNQADQRLRSFMPHGTMFRAELDEEFWLNFGLGGQITVWFGSNDTLVAAPPVSVAARFPEIERLHLAGLLWPEAAARLARTAYATRESVGRGQVILFADHPVYRRWMKESERMFSNAVLLGPGLGTRWSTPW